MRESKVLVLLSMLVSSMLAGCMLSPIDERGTIYTPAPTRAVTADPGEPPLEEWQGLFIPKQCVRGVPLGWGDNTLMAISPSGQWIAYGARAQYKYHFSIYNLETGEWRRPAVPFSFYEVKWDTYEQGLYYLSGSFEKPEDRQLWWMNLETMQAKEIRDCPHCVEFDVLETESILAATRRIKRGWLQIDMVGWTEPFTAAVTIDSVKRGSVGPISLSPHGKRLAYSTEIETKGQRRVQFPMRIQELGSGAIVTLTENSMPDAWLTDDVILDPDPEAMRVWKHNLVTGERVIFAEVDRDLSSVYAIGQGSPYTGMRGVAIARDTRFLLFTPIREPPFSTGTIYVADLRCSRRVSAAQK